MIIVCTILIAFGVFWDSYESLIRLIKYLSRKRSPSATPLVGFIFVFFGLFGLKYLTDLSISLLNLFLLIFGALLLHASLQIILPILITMLCNKYYGRNLSDSSPLPPQIRGGKTKH